MSIAKKLTTIAENTPKVYNQGYEDGKNSVVRLEKFIKTMRIYNFNEFGTKELEFNFEKANEFRNMFSIQTSGKDNGYFEKNTTVEHLTVSTKALVIDMYRMFYCDNYCIDETMKRITLNFDIDPDYGVNMNNIFQNMQGLEVIDGKPLNVASSASFNNTFFQCVALKEVQFVENTIKSNISFAHSPNLSTETTQSIIDGLADLTGGTAQELAFHADIVLKLTDEQILQITNKNWSVS